ncbi:MAG: hypothetical protein LC772_01675, partial [Chloroflexi bacterium]|nr:hypothetical protein [Chloroflexota bacterium]
MAEIPNSHDGADGASAPKPLMMFYQKDGEITAQTLNGAGLPTAITGPAASTTTPAQSRDLLHYWNLLKRYRWALVLSVVVCTSISAYIALHTPRVYSASSTILVSGKDASRALLMPEIGVGGPNNDLNTQVIVIKALAVMKIASDMLKAEGLSIPPGAVSGSIMVENIPDTSVITVTAEAGRPRDASEIANAVARAYVQYQYNRARQSDTTTVGFLDRELKTANQTLAAAERRLLAFQDELARMGMDVTAGSSAGSSGATAPITSSASSDLRMAQTALQSALQQQFIDQQHIADARKKLAQLASALMSQHSAAIQNNTMVYTLQTQLEEKEGELADARTRLSPAGVQKLYPGLTEDVARLRNLLNQQVGNLAGGNTVDLNLQQSLNTQLYQAQGDLNTIQPQIPALRQRVAALSTQVLQEPGLAVRLNRLVRDRDVSQTVYQMLLEREKQVQISRSAVQSDASIISTATIPSMPIRPDRKREIIIGIFVGLALGIVAIYLLDFLDTSVRTWSDVREKVGLPVLGAIPAGEVLPATVWEKFHRSVAAEAYRMLRSNVGFVNVDSEVKTLMVTSSGPREGKSSTISNLAAAMAQEGKRVVVVDADMRKPSLY